MHSFTISGISLTNVPWSHSTTSHDLLLWLPAAPRVPSHLPIPNVYVIYCIQLGLRAVNRGLFSWARATYQQIFQPRNTTPLSQAITNCPSLFRQEWGLMTPPLAWMEYWWALSSAGCQCCYSAWCIGHACRRESTSFWECKSWFLPPGGWAADSRLGLSLMPALFLCNLLCPGHLKAKPEGIGLTAKVQVLRVKDLSFN